jgi:hypothetical protein
VWTFSSNMPFVRAIPRQRPRSASLGIFLGNAVVLACVMLWFGVVNTTQDKGSTWSDMSVSSNKEQQQQRSPEFFGTKAHSRIRNLPFRRPVENIDLFQGINESVEADGKKEEAIHNVDHKYDSHHTSNRERVRTSFQIGRTRTMGNGTNSTTMTRRRSKSGTTLKPASHPCSNFDAVLHIKSGDQGAASGTLFFQYVINQLIYADMHNLMPLIHLDNVTHHVYDEDVHGVGDGLNLTVSGELKVVLEHDATRQYFWPGKPRADKQPVVEKKLWFRGTGVWNHYLEPVSEYDPNNAFCRKLPYLTLEYEHLTPGIHAYAPWAVRSWEYLKMPPYLRHNSSQRSGLRDWYAPQRLRAHEIVTKYYRFRPHVSHAARQLVPDGTRCLAVHIRHSDKGGLARKKIPVAEFLPYVMAYAQHGGKVYLATDSSRVVEQVEKEWAQSSLIVQGGIVRSAISKPVFRQGSHNRTNTEVLVDILAMSRCQFIVHGFSAVSEATHYLNPSLHNRSVDLEDPKHITAFEFGELIKAENSLMD